MGNSGKEWTVVVGLLKCGPWLVGDLIVGLADVRPADGQRTADGRRTALL